MARTNLIDLPALLIIAGILFYSRENLYPRNLSIDAVSPKTRKFNATKIRTLRVRSSTSSFGKKWNYFNNENKANYGIWPG